MKKIIFFLSLVFTSSLFSQTTEDEYNYMTKGYKIQITSGLDPKSGYSITDLVTMNRSSYEFTFKLLLRQKDETLAGVIVVAKSKGWGNEYYLGIPIDNPNLLNIYETEIAKWDEPMTTAYAQCTSALFSNFVNALIKEEKKKK